MLIAAQAKIIYLNREKKDGASSWACTFALGMRVNCRLDADWTNKKTIELFGSLDSLKWNPASDENKGNFPIWETWCELA